MTEKPVEFSHKGTALLKTERLVLRRLELADAQAMFENWASDPAVTKYLSWPTHKNVHHTIEYLIQVIEKYQDAGYYDWVLVAKSLGKPIGNIGCVHHNDQTRMLDVGYCIGKQWWHQGYTSEALAALIRFFFETVGANRIQAEHDTRNQHSGSVMKKCGMLYEGTTRQSATNNAGNLCDQAHYAILARDYFAEKNGD
jgi:ribosomal-protein-alanine N-acetyltransferase